MPESTSDESGESRAEAWLLSFGSDSQVYVIPQPVIGVDVPESQVGTCILCCLDLPGHNVGQAIPFRTTGLRINAVVSDTAKNASALGQTPDTVVFHASYQAEHVKLPHSPQEAIVHILAAQIERGWVVRGQLKKGDNP